MSYSYANRSFRRYQKPVEVGKEYEADIIELSHRGDAGVAKIQGFVLFVSNAKKGDRVKFKITRVGRRFATAELMERKLLSLLHNLFWSHGENNSG